MGTVTVTTDTGNRYSVEVRDVGTAERMRLAALAPDEIAEMGAEMDDPSDVPDEELLLTEDMIDYLLTAITTTTDLEESELDLYPTDFLIKLGTEVLNEIFSTTDDNSGNRVRSVRVDESALVALFSGECSLVAGLPDDITFVDFKYVPATQEIEFIFKSSEWSPVESGEEIPAVETQFVGFPVSE